MNLTLPVFNEKRVLPESIAKLIAFFDASNRFPDEIVILNNGSTDRTQAVAEDLTCHHPCISVINLATAGRGYALKNAWTQSHADILSYMDIDLATDLNAYWPMIDALAAGNGDLATGSRRLSASKVIRSPLRKSLSEGYHTLLRAVFHTHFSDAQCGFKAITKPASEKLLPFLKDTGWFFDSELLIVAEKLGYRILEVPVSWTESRYTKVKICRSAFDTLKEIARLRRDLALGRIHSNALLTSAHE